MNENTLEASPEGGTNRRTILKGAAWSLPVVAAVAATPLAAASTEPEPEEATSIGGTATSPRVGNPGFLRVFGLDDLGEEGFFPTGQTFELESSDPAFDTYITAIIGGTVTPTTAGKWLVTPNPSPNTAVRINFNSPVTLSYSITSLGPVDIGTPYSGNVLPPL